MITLNDDELELHNIKEASILLTIGRTKIFELMNAGTIKAVKLGSSTRISTAEIKRFIKSAPARASEPALQHRNNA